MKKLQLIIVLSLVLSTTGFSYAQSLNTASGIRAGSSAAVERNALITQAQNNKVQDLKTRADTEIERRLNALNLLIIKVNSFKRLSSAQKSDFQTQIQTQISGLTTLKTKIDADTDLTTLRADVKSIVTDYYVFAFFIGDINILATAERIETALDNMNTVSGKLQTRISAASQNGQDVSSLTALLTAMEAKTTDAKTLSDQVISDVSTLNAQGYPGNKTTLINSRANLKTAYADIQTAFSDAKQIIQGLKELNKTTPTATGSSVTNP